MTEPCDLPAREARRLIGTKALSPLELLESCEQRIAEQNPRLNALVALDLDAARAAARQAGDAVTAGRPLGLLHGLPIGVKDMEATRGLTTTWGALIHKDFVPTRDELHVRRIREAGGIILGKTNVPEFGAGSNTTNRVYGPTGNPFDADKTCGGSSGGSAVVLACGMVPLATGSDFGGSLRTPAAFCGVVGFRPSPGLVPYPARAALLSPMTVLGPMARNVADAHLFLLAQLGADRGDPFSAAGADAIPATLQPADLSTLRAAFSVDLGCAPVDREIARVFRERTALFGHVFRSQETRDPELGDALEIFETVRGLNLLTGFGDTVARHRTTLGPNLISGVEMGAKLTVNDVARAQLGQSRLFQRFARLFEEVDVLICPAAAVSPFPHRLLYPETINGEKLPHYMSWYAIAYLLSLALPSIVCLPCGVDHEGMPFGLQVVGPMGSDARVLAVAAALEQELARHPQTRRPLPDWVT
jgi:Asp-tRNA(Asn)/Glu-tRNA(Gln) amidotransferase A subunit family amidase